MCRANTLRNSQRDCQKKTADTLLSFINHFLVEMLYKSYFALALLLFPGTQTFAQNAAYQEKAKKDLNAYFVSYQAKNTDFSRQPRLKELRIDDKQRKVTVVPDPSFAQQELNDKQIGKIYKKVHKLLPKVYRDYDLSIVVSGLPLENYATDYTSLSGNALWGKIRYDGQPWVSDVSRPFRITHGLYNRHLVVWASHGRYYDAKKGQWQWQRPPLFGTCEDLFTETIVLPYLIPMLENAGAVVYTPRERDLQTEEYVVDNDGVNAPGYSESDEGRQWNNCPRSGFAYRLGNYVDGQNPFKDGTARMTKTTKKGNGTYALWQPRLQKAGHYAVYVSYQTVDKSVDDAHYVVFHKGQATEVRVNQQMGSGTWVYLGTFDFDQGKSIDNCVMLTNQSKRRGIVTADAVRFGGGMGNISRGGVTSGLPRVLEGSRYFCQWAGAPYNIYSSRGGSDDYADDINSRSRMLNWLAGGSVYVPTVEGEHVPFELSLAVHSDAGYAPNGKDLVGSLAICTTNYNDGQLSSGLTRQASKMLAKDLLDNLTRDLTYKYGNWVRRYLWDRNYSETRVPEVPSAILETLSHQNFPDMKLAQDPHFKFTLARSVYKTLARYVNTMHGRPTIIEPLPPKDPAVTINNRQQAHVSWIAQDDPQEPSAHPDYYVLYTAIGKGGYDNGQKVKTTSVDLDVKPGVLYRFKVTAINRGGESFPSEEIALSAQSGAQKSILVVNGFHRLSAPTVIDNNSQQGFDMKDDIGVSYGPTIGWLGYQQSFNKSRIGRESSDGLGYTDESLAGKVIAGNNLDAATAHVEAIAGSGKYNVVSCSSYAVETRRVTLHDFDAVDMVLGLEKYSPDALVYDKTFTDNIQKQLTAYTKSGGKLLVSGAYVGADMTGSKESDWLSGTLKVNYSGSLRTDTLQGVNGLQQNFDFYRIPNADHYAATHADILQPADGAVCAMQYNNGYSAAVAYKGNDYRSFTMAFPFECITDKNMQRRLMTGILNFLLK